MTELYDMARHYEPRFANTFVAETARLRSRITDDIVAQVMGRPLTDEPRELYDLVDRVTVAKEGEQEVYASLIAEAGRMELRLHGHGKLAGELKLTSPFVLESARKHAANLVTAVSKETKRAIRRVIFEAIRDGDPPATAAQTIRTLVGLTERHAVAVQRFAAEHTREGTVRYAKKLLNLRARNIARTETIRASRAGQQVAWREMVRDGLIDTSRFQQRWLVTDDDRLCELCAPMDGTLVGLGGSFESTEKGVLPSERVAYSGETVDGPPLHPSCRCALVGDFG